MLEVDHIIPVSEGGSDEMDNLTTSCWECNRGKGATLLDDRAPVTDIHDQTIVILERELQLREYNHVREMQREREDNDIEELLDYWDFLAGGSARKYPSVSTLRNFLRKLSKFDIRDAMDIAYERKGDWRGVDYLYGILHNWTRDKAHDDEVE